MASARRRRVTTSVLIVAHAWAGPVPNRNVRRNRRHRKECANLVASGQSRKECAHFHAIA